ncbi:hypothetical protein ADL30_01475 [Streptomyces sp. NRRL S-1521]|nr:hypothetical protein ADL30_01475 [Streptomyces sp. NRRL S-1521]
MSVASRVSTASSLSAVPMTSRGSMASRESASTESMEPMRLVESMDKAAVVFRDRADRDPAG